MRLLYAMSYSPWSERARWALDHHALAYREIAHTPLTGELRLRLAAHRPFSKVTVPLLIDEKRRIEGSGAIALHADDIGSAPTLFPTPRRAEIDEWDAKSERIMQAGRVLVLRAIASSRQARVESLAGTLPAFLRGPLDGVAFFGTSYLARKYGATSRSEADARREIASVLDEIRRAIKTRRHLLGDLTYADVTIACALGFVKPVAEPWLTLGPATRRAWTIDKLAVDYVDVLEWRDAVYARDRKSHAT